MYDIATQYRVHIQIRNLFRTRIPLPLGNLSFMVCTSYECNSHFTKSNNLAECGPPTPMWK